MKQPALLALVLLAACSSQVPVPDPVAVEPETIDPAPVDEDVPPAPGLRFYEFARHRHYVQLFWHESPHYADNRITLETPLEDCDDLALFVYASEGASPQVTATGATTTPMRLRNTQEELAAWSQLPEDPCSALITAAYWIEDAFTGLSFSTRDGVFRRVPARLPPPATDSAPQLQTLEGISQRLEDAFPEDWVGREITVSFDFPGGRRAKTTLSLENAAKLLDGPWYQSTAMGIDQPWNSVRFWARAALAMLDLDFREQAEAESGAVSSTVLVSIDGVRGAWWFDPRDGRSVTSKLSTPVENARYIRFRME